MIDDLVFEPLGDNHNRSAFTCSGDEGLVLQDYLRNDARARREHRRHVTTVHVMLRKSDPSQICGYFTLSTATLEIEGPMPALKLGRMAVSDAFRGYDFGTLLVERAFRICLSLRESVGFIALLVDAKTDELVAYYEKRGFSRFLERPRGLYIMQTTMAQILGATATRP